jgi:tRNA-dihydrouridine synthase B
MQLGPYTLANALFAAPMAGVTDRPFRMLCKRLGAGYAVSEMVTSRPELRDSLKTSRRMDHAGEGGPIAVQIAGTDAPMMAEAAQYNMDRGAQIIDINMGCPAKKVCNKWAGSALMQNEPLATDIVQAVVAVCAPRGVPVTLKMRTGWSNNERNAVRLARMAADAGVSMITVHGRTREQGYSGLAEYDTIAAVKAAVSIPVVANGDIDSPRCARAALDFSRSGTLSGARPTHARARAQRGEALAHRTLTRPLSSIRRVHGPAHGAQTHWLVCATLARRRNFSPLHEHPAQLRSPTGRSE